MRPVYINNLLIGGIFGLGFNSTALMVAASFTYGVIATLVDIAVPDQRSTN